jgi:hypothetical protein
LYEHVQNEESLTQKEKRGKGNNKALWCGQWATDGEFFMFFEFRSCQIFRGNISRSLGTVYFLYVYLYF